MANHGLVIDLGTTAISAYLINLENNSVINGHVVENPQRQEQEIGARRQAMINQANAVIDSLCAEMGLSGEDIREVVVVGNPAMIDLWFGRISGIALTSLASINHTDGTVLKAMAFGLRINPEGEVIIPPAVGGMIGCDTTAGLLTNNLFTREDLSLYVDLGTYATVVLGTQEGFVSTSVYGGVFEGVGLRDGMVATTGAIYKVDFNLSPPYKVYGACLPQGICGAGVIDTLSHLRSAGVINEKGKIDRANAGLRANGQTRAFERVIELDGQPAFLIASPRETSRDQGIALTQADIDKTVRAKAMVLAATRILLRKIGVEVQEIKNIYLTGSLGNAINFRHAINLGLIPAVDCNIFYISNAAGKGATQILRNRKNLDVCYQIKERIKAVEVKSDPDFEQLVSQNMVLCPTANGY